MTLRRLVLRPLPQPRHLLIALVSVYFLAQVFVAGPVLRHHLSRVIFPDSATYEQPALALLEDGRFWTAPGSGQPEIVRTPGYPTLIAAVYLVAPGNKRGVILVQIIMNCMMIIMVSLIAGPAGKWTGLIAALLLCLDMVFFSSALHLLTETFFAFLLVLFAAASVAMVSARTLRGQYSLAGLAGLCLACATLTRPVTYYLHPLLAPALAVGFWRGGHAPRRAAACAAVFLLPFIILCVGWQARNWRASGSAELSQIKNANLLLYRAAGIVSIRDGIPFDQAQKKLDAAVRAKFPEARGAELYEAYGVEGKRVIRAEPVLLARIWIVGFVKMMLSSGDNALRRLLGAERSSGPAGDLIQSGPGAFFRTWVVGRPAEFLLFALTLLHLGFMYLCGALAVWRLQSHSPTLRTAILLSAVVIIYLVVVSSGPEAYSRFRVPLAPFLALLAGLGLSRMAGQSAIKTSPCKG